MGRELIEHIRKYIEVAERDVAPILNFFQPLHFVKKQTLMEQGTRCKYHYFVVKGCLRMFFLDEKGVEQTTQFAIEGWWITDYQAFDRQANTDFAIQAVEATEVLRIDYERQENLFKQFPQFERYYRLVYQRAYSALQLREKYFYDFSRTQFYQHFNDHFPDFTKRIPQHLLASYLHMTPEYLSEIKKKLLS